MSKFVTLLDTLKMNKLTKQIKSLSIFKFWPLDGEREKSLGRYIITNCLRMSECHQPNYVNTSPRLLDYQEFIWILKLWKI